MKWTSPALLVCLSGCAAPFSTFHSARTTPYKQVELNSGVGLNVDGTFLGSSWDAGRIAAEKASDALDDEQVTLTQEETAALGRTSLAYLLVPPSPIWEGSLRYGLARRWELGGTWTSSGLGAHLLYQVQGQHLGHDTPLDMALGLQVHRQTFDLGLPKLLELLVDLEDMSRTDISVPLVLGSELGDLGWVSFGAKGFCSIINADLVESVTDKAGVDANVSGTMWGGGVFGSAALGYRYAFLVLELNVLYHHYEPEFLGQVLDFSGFDIYPAIGVQIHPYKPEKRLQ